MKLILPVICFFCLLHFQGKCDGEFKVLGARASGMGGVSVTAYDQWSAGNNQAGNAWIPGISCGLFYENRFMVKELSYQAFAVTMNGKPGAFSAVCVHFGTSLYNETKAGCAYSRKFGKHFSTGVQVDYYRIQIADGYGSKNLFNCELGLMFMPDRHWVVGFHCLNPVPVRILSDMDESLSTLILLGLSYCYSDALILSAEVEKDILNKPLVRIGAEYRFARILSARIGVNTVPFQFSIGAGILAGRFSIDLASEYHQYLGFSPSVSLQYQIRNEKKIHAH
jgi:hypothetical protein